MAEGGGYFGFDDPHLDYDIDHDYDEEQEINTTGGFQPGAVSTPNHGGEQIQTMIHEQSGLPDTSYAETILLSDFMTPEHKQAKISWSIEFIQRRFPKVNLEKLGPIGISKKAQQKSFHLGQKVVRPVL